MACTAGSLRAPDFDEALARLRPGAVLVPEGAAVDFFALVAGADRAPFLAAAGLREAAVPAGLRAGTVPVDFALAATVRFAGEDAARPALFLPATR